jgi:hypothetical protein
MSTAVNVDVRSDGRVAKKELREVAREIKGLGVVSKLTGSRATQLGFAIGTVVAATGAAAIALGRMIAQTADLGDQTAKMARNVGVSAEALQTLQFAAGRSGVEMTALNNGLKRLSRNMLDSVSGNKRMADTFKAIGVNVRESDGSLRKVEDVFRDLSDVSATLGESAEGTGLRMLLLGRAGAELGNLMAEGSDGLDAMSARLDTLGGRMSGELLQSSEDYQDAILDLTVAFQGLQNEVAERSLPSMTEFAEELALVAAGAGDLLDSVGDGAAKSGLVFAFESWKQTILTLLPPLRVVGDIVDGVSSAFNSLSDRGAGLAAGGPPADLPMGGFFPNHKGEELRKRLGGGAGGAGGGKSDEEKAAEAERKRAEIIERQIRGMERRIALATASGEQQIRLSAMFAEQDVRRRVAAGELNELEAEKLRLLNQQQTMIDLVALRQAEAAEAAKVEAEALRALRREEEEHAAKMIRLEEERAAHRVEVARSSVESVTGWLQVGADAAGMIFDAEAKKNKAAAKQAFEARRAFLISQTIIGGLAGSINAFASAPNYIVGAIQSALVGAQTAIAVGKIATEQPSFGDAGLMPLGSLRDTHRSAVIKNDEMVVDSVGTRDVSAMFAMMRRGMELSPKQVPPAGPTNLYLDGELVASNVSGHLANQIELGNDYRERVRV